MVQDDWRSLLRAVIYVVQFDTDPTQAVDRVLTHTIDQGRSVLPARCTALHWHRRWQVTMHWRS